MSSVFLITNNVQNNSIKVNNRSRIYDLNKLDKNKIIITEGFDAEIIFCDVTTVNVSKWHKTLIDNKQKG